MENVNFAERRLREYGNSLGFKLQASGFRLFRGYIYRLVSLACSVGLVACSTFASEIKQPNVAGSFYPDNPSELSQMVDTFLDAANPVRNTEALGEENKISNGVNPQPEEGNIFALISPHAGYGFSGGVAAFGYKLIQGKPYKTVLVIGRSHRYNFSGASVYPEGKFRTPLGDIEVDKGFAQKLLKQDPEVTFKPEVFSGEEHTVEVQLPFLQKVLKDFKIVPIIVGDMTLSNCQKLADLLKNAIGERKDVLMVASTDMYHGGDYPALEATDNLTISYLKNMDSAGLYYGLREEKLQLCGGFAVVTALILSKELGHKKLQVLKYTNSAEVTGAKSSWMVGYVSCAIDQERSLPAGRQGGVAMLNKTKRKRLLEIARNSIEAYLKTNKKMELTETDPLLLKEMGAFVTLHKHGELAGCIGNLIGQQPLYLTVRDMAVAAAVDDPRFSPVTLQELKALEIEISMLTPLKRIESTDEIEMGVHGVLLKSGFNSGVFLPQVATETGWSKEEFLSNLCSHKAGLPALAWKDKSTEIYIFTAEVFSEKSY